MSVLINRSTKVVVQGITGREGAFHTKQMVAYGTQVVAGVTPGKGGQEVEGVPVFDTVAQAVEVTGANTSVIFVPAPFAPDACLEAADAGVVLAVCLTEHIPVNDMVTVVSYLSRGCTRLLGPNCPGLITPGESKVGIISGNIATPGPVGVVARSGTLAYETVDRLTREGMGQTTIVGIGGDPVPGTRFVDALRLFEADEATKVVVMIGEIGGTDEEDAAEYIKTMTKPVVAFISGRTAPPGKRMGHAGAIVSGNKGTAAAKVEALTAAGVPVPLSTREIPALVRERLG
jgi:succinyl-CoA synthetase alpha subunit